MKQFNFRHVTKKCGIPSTNENNWAVGQILCNIAAKHGIEPNRILTAKTDPHPTVDAPHCIGHYPMRMFDECCERIDEMWNDKTRQFTMEF